MDFIEQKVEDFLKSSKKFQEACSATWQYADQRGTGKVDVASAAQCVNYLFDRLQGALDEYGIKVKRPDTAEVQELFKKCDFNADYTLDQTEFQSFYAKVLKYAAMKFAVGFGKKYGYGIIGGIVGLAVLKRGLRALPVVGPVLSPVLALIPTGIVGPVAGCAVVYGLEHGDLMAFRDKLFPRKNNQFNSF